MGFFLVILSSIPRHTSILLLIVIIFLKIIYNYKTNCATNFAIITIGYSAEFEFDMDDFISVVSDDYSYVVGDSDGNIIDIFEIYYNNIISNNRTLKVNKI